MQTASDLPHRSRKGARNERLPKVWDRPTTSHHANARWEASTDVFGMPSNRPQGDVGREKGLCKMTTIDHQQAAIGAIAAALHGDACPADPDPGESCGCGGYEREAENALTAATPHLRAGVAKEMRDFRDCYQHTYAIPGDPYADGYLTACNAIIALLEGSGE